VISLKLSINWLCLHSTNIFYNVTDAAITAWTAPAALTGASGHIEITDSKAENSVNAGAELFTVTATTDATSVSYVLTSSTDSIGVEASGKINVAAGKVLNYETASKYTFVVE